MARKNVHGVCKLCHKTAKLCKSHYLGRVLYKLSRVGGEDPVVMTPKLVTITPRQMWAHLLCEVCEQKLNKLGEKPVLKLFNDASDNFPLLNRMNLAIPHKVEGKAIIYSGEAIGIDTEPLAHYALGVLWKGSVHKWITLKRQESTVDLGKYQEPIRRYLVGEAGFPNGVYITVTVCIDLGSQITIYAPSKLEETQYPTNSFLARGLWFHIITTDDNPKGLSGLCSVRSPKKLLYKADCKEIFLKAGQHIRETATVSA